MTGINSWWLQRYKWIFVTSKLSQRIFNHNTVIWFILNLLSWLTLRTKFITIFLCVEVSVNILFQCISSWFFSSLYFCITSHSQFFPCVMLWSWSLVFVSPFRPLTVQNVKMCWNLSRSGAEVSHQLDIPFTKNGEGAQYLFLYLSSSTHSPPSFSAETFNQPFSFAFPKAMFTSWSWFPGHLLYLKYHEVSTWR